MKVNTPIKYMLINIFPKIASLGVTKRTCIWISKIYRGLVVWVAGHSQKVMIGVSEILVDFPGFLRLQHEKLVIRTKASRIRTYIAIIFCPIFKTMRRFFRITPFIIAVIAA